MTSRLPTCHHIIFPQCPKNGTENENPVATDLPVAGVDCDLVRPDHRGAIVPFFIFPIKGHIKRYGWIRGLLSAPFELIENNSEQMPIIRFLFRPPEETYKSASYVVIISDFSSDFSSACFFSQENVFCQNGKRCGGHNSQGETNMRQSGRKT